MFGRRRPILGAAVLVGASRSAARHEVERQAERDAQVQMAADRSAEKRLLEEKERERRTQMAIEEAMAKERVRTDTAENLAYRSDPMPTGYVNTNQMGSAPPYTAYGPSTGEQQCAQAKFCSNCGYECAREDKFCSRCGRKKLNKE